MKRWVTEYIVCGQNGMVNESLMLLWLFGGRCECQRPVAQSGKFPARRSSERYARDGMQLASARDDMG